MLCCCCDVWLVRNGSGASLKFNLILGDMMRLYFRIEENRKRDKPRVEVVRMTKDAEGKKKAQIVGSFGRRSLPEDLFDKLTDDERYQLENFVAALDFSKKFFGTAANELDEIFIKVDKNFQDALKTLWKLAKKYNVEFVPQKEMLYALFNRAKKVEQEINKLSGKKNKVLEKLGITIEERTGLFASDQESRKLFQALLTLKQPLEKICKEFQQIAQQKYQKRAKFEPYYFNWYADTTENSETKRFPSWYYTIAVDLLVAYGINPLTLITPTKVVKHWVRLRIDRMKLNEAKKEFVKTFSPSKKIEAVCLESLDAFYLANEQKIP